MECKFYLGGKMVYITLEELAKMGIYFSKRVEEAIASAEKAKYDKDFTQKRTEAYCALKDLEDFNKKALPEIKKIFGDDEDESQNELEREMKRLKVRLKAL